MKSKLVYVLTIVMLLSLVLSATPVGANPPAPEDGAGNTPTTDGLPARQSSQLHKAIDRPNAQDYLRIRERQRLLDAARDARTAGKAADAQALEAQAALLDQSGTDRVLVILVEFTGTDVFTWTEGVSQWDPLGRADPNEAVTDAGGDVVIGDCSNIITQTTVFTYSGPVHNQIPRPLSPDDRSGNSIWTEDFSPTWFNDFMFGNGVAISYTMVDSTTVYESFIGQSVADYYTDLSNGVYTITGDVVGWLGVPHSTWYYDADQCPGARSGGGGRGGYIDGAGNTRDLVRDSLDAVNAISDTLFGGTFDWANYDLDGNGVIDRLWIVHAGYGEEDGTVLLNRTDYGEAAVWSHSSQLTPAYSVTADIAAGPYIAMPENGGIGVFAHEYGHNLGADDLYAYGNGDTSTGFWSLMSDDWTGFPIGFEPPAVDPWHLDNWGWLAPFVASDPNQVYTVTLGQASYFDTNTYGGPDPVYRGIKIPLEDGQIPLAVLPLDSYGWWGGKLDLANASMTSVNPIAVPTGGALSVDMAYGIETEWDFLWVQVSTDMGTTWDTLSNTNTTCSHVSGWIGALYGMDSACGFTDYNASFPGYDTETFDLSAYAGQNILLRFWYMTDWGTTNEGAFIDNIVVSDGLTPVFSDNAEAGGGNWSYVDPWIHTNGYMSFTHNFYAQWRNVNDNGGYDSALGESRWRYGPANTGLVMWYNNNSKTDTEVANYLNEYPGFGPKGRMLVIDSQPDPYREPAMVAAGYDNEGGNVTHRGLMRDAPFTLQDTVDFTMTNAAYPYTTTSFTTHFEGRPAVSEFSDALGYYPSAEYISRGPGYVPPSYKWATKQWDASVTMPSKAFYGIKAPGYIGEGPGQQEFRYKCNSTATGRLSCSGYTGLGYNGGSGNPIDANGQYGWHVELIEEAADHTWARVVVYNDAGSVVVEPSGDTELSPLGGQPYDVAYQVVVRNDTASVASNVSVTFTLDAKLTLDALTAEPTVGNVTGTNWSIAAMNPGEVVTLALTANATAGWADETLYTQVDAFDGETMRGPWLLSTAIAPQFATVMHTNDFHGNLDPSGSNPGMARTAYVINTVRDEVGADSVALLDGGDIMQSTLLSNLFYGESTIDIYNQVGYDVATFGNHEFDWGQQVLLSRTQQATFPFVAANLVVSDSGSCTTAGWSSPSFATPWITKTIGSGDAEITLGIIGLTSQETPYITIASATDGLCFKDAAESFSHYYPDVIAAGADVIIALTHLGNTDGGYGYGIPVYGDQTLATMLQQAGTPADLIIGGHSHTDLAAAQNVNGTLVVQAHYAGRKVGRADISVNPDTGDVAIRWQRLTVSTSGAQDPDILNAIAVWSSDPWYQGLINQVIGFTSVDLVRNYNGDSLMGKFVNDAIYNDLNNDAEPLNDADIVFNNPGGLRADLTGAAITQPLTLTHGLLYSVLPFGNQTIVGDMTGAHILDLLNQSATLFKGALQVGGARYTFYRYSDALPGPQPWAWGAYSITVYNRSTLTWDPLVMTQTYRVATNEFLAPAGQDGFAPFKYMTNISYWGDMLDGVERWVADNYPVTSPYSETLDGRITRDGDDTGGSVVAVTLLHHNDSHGRLTGSVNYAKLATIIKQERAHNPDRNLLLNAGDSIQGDSMMYYFKSAALGYAADGTPLTGTLSTHPFMAVMNAMTYTAMTLGNHEFNFGRDVFTSTFQQANFPVLQANLYDDGSYGIATAGVLPDTSVSLPGPVGSINVAILGIGNHRVPNYELPSNIPGLNFTNPITEAQTRAPALKATHDVVVALTHIGFTENLASVEVDENVDTNLAAQAGGIDAIIGGHSHTPPYYDSVKFGSGNLALGAYKYLPAIVGNPDNSPVIINQANRYNTYLGEIALGLLPNGSGGYDVVARSGRYVEVASSTAEDAEIAAIVAPYKAAQDAYNVRTVGLTTRPIDTNAAYIQETNGANLQADASVWELSEHGVGVDFHLSGAMTNRAVAASATTANPYTLTVADMFTLMPYENSLLALQMNGPQLKAVLERGYRNYYWYNIPGAGGYSYYTTCFLDINAGGKIIYRDTYPTYPNGDNVAALILPDGRSVNFADADTYYTVSTVNYLAAGSCNYNDGGVSLWPLDQLVADTQYYVRDAVINYVTAQGIVTPEVEGRIVFMPQTVQQTITGPGTYTFGDTCVELTFEPGMTGTLTTVTATLVYSAPTYQTINLPLARRYEITGDGTGFTAILSMCYNDADVAAAGLVEDDLALYRYEGGGAWTAYPGGVDTTANIVTATISSFSVWAMGTPTNAPTAITLQAVRSLAGSPFVLGVVLTSVVTLLLAGVWVARRKR